MKKILAERARCAAIVAAWKASTPGIAWAASLMEGAILSGIMPPGFVAPTHEEDD